MPNATVMLIRSAERYGMAQLHQLRGRVGLGEAPGHCFLEITDGVQLGEPAQERLQAVCNSNNGLELAEAGLANRGEGNLGGTEQPGHFNLLRTGSAYDLSMLEQARNLAEAIQGEGHITVPYKTFHDLTKSLPDSSRIDLDLEKSSHILRIAAGRSTTHVNGTDGKDFPPSPQFDAGQRVEFPPEELVRAVACIHHSATKDNARPVLQGIQIQMAPELMTMAAADGFRLSAYRHQTTLQLEDALSAIVPTEAMRTVARIARGQREPVIIAMSPDRNSLRFETLGAGIHSQLINGTFPNWEQLVPQEAKTVTTMEGADSQQLCHAAGILARDGANMIRMEFKPADGGDQAEEVSNHVASVGARIDGEPQPHRLQPQLPARPLQRGQPRPDRNSRAGSQSAGGSSRQVPPPWDERMLYQQFLP